MEYFVILYRGKLAMKPAIVDRSQVTDARTVTQVKGYLHIRL